MPALQFILTTAGKNAIVNANNTGTNPVVIDRMAIGSTSWTPTAAATALNTEIKKITAIGGGVVADDTIHVTAQDASSDVYTVREIGLYTAGNVLLAIYAQADPIITKGAGTVALIAADLVITGIPAGSVTVGDTTFNYPQATETVKGVAELATTAEAQAGTDDERIITPKKLQDVTATATRKGVVELATDAEATTGADTARATTPANVAAVAALYGFPSAKALALGSNLNSISATGFYRAETGGGAYANQPVRPGGQLNYDFDLIHIQAATGNASQMCFAAQSELYIRVKDFSTWSAWEQVVMFSNEAANTQKGVISLATLAEALAGTETGKAITPAVLAGVTAGTGRIGLVELATAAEAQAGTDGTRAVTPLALAAVTATDTRAGLIELANNAEAQAGSDDTRAITPAKLQAVTSTQTRAGVIRTATQAETAEGTAGNLAVTPNTLRLYPGTCRAWVNFNGAGTVAIRSSHGVSSITDRGVGRYTINWDGVFGSSNYCFVAAARQINDVSDSCTVSPRSSESKTTSALQISVTEGADLQDSTEICVAAFA